MRQHHMTLCLVNHHIRSPSVCSCVLQLIIPHAAKFMLLPPSFMLKTRVQNSIVNYTQFTAKLMNKGTVRHQCRVFKDGQTNVHNAERSGQPSVVNDDPIQRVGQKICEN